MSELVTTIQEDKAAAAFSKQAPIFDELYVKDGIIAYKRKRVREHVLSFLPASSSILELNAGTGEDAIYFAQQGHTVHATDISQGMQDALLAKVKSYNLNSRISTERCSFTALEKLKNPGPYDLVFSNFAGLNCTPQLDKVLDSLKQLVRPGGYATLVLLPKFCLWEFLLLFRGKFKTAFRRFSGKKGTPARIDGQHFRCWYYNPSFIRRHLKGSFEIIKLEGLCTIVPPSYIEGFAKKHPRLFHFLGKREDKWKSNWWWRVVGDYYIVTVRRV